MREELFSSLLTDCGGAQDLFFVVEKDMKLLGLSIGPKGVSIPFSPQFVCHHPLKANSLVF
jgi:hypothetical protein